MFAGFDPTQAQEPYFQRRRGTALAAAIFVHLLVLAVIVYLEMTRSDESIEDVVLDDPEIENLDIEEEMEIEEEEEPEPEPEPEPEKPQRKPQNEIQNVTEQTKDLSESDVAAAKEEVETAPAEKKVEEKKAEKPAEEKKVEKKKRRQGVGDREKPRAMPADGTPPKPEKGNKAPKYPESLRSKNITGTIKLKLKIYMDGSVRGVKVLKKSIKGTDDQKEIEKAQKLFLKAVVAAIKTWKFKPAKLRGQTITVWWPVTIPFNLN